MKEIDKQIPLGKVKPPNVLFLKVWQGIELFMILAFFAVTFLMYAFSGDKGIAFSWSILWKVFILKVIVMFFFFKKKKWAVIFNVVQNSAMLIFIAYSIYYSFMYGNTDKLLLLFIVFAIIILVGLFYLFLTKEFLRYLKYLKDK
jgi:hypothetical protein